MGPRSSRTQNQQISNLSKNLLIHLAFPKVCQRFQKAEFFYKTKQMKIHIPVDNAKIINQWQQNIKILHQEDMKKYLLLPKSYEFQKQAICGSSGLAKIVYDYFPYSLDGQIQNRKKSIINEQFNESQIWKILYCLTKAAQLMHKNWKKIGDVRPKNIFYNQQRQLRASCQYSYPSQLTNYQKFIFQREPTYLSPEQLYDFKMGRIQPNSTRNAKQHIIQGESWSIGLTLLHITLLFNCQKLYQPLKGNFNFELLQEKIKDLQNKRTISLALKNIIKGMLQQIPQRRLLTCQLDQIIVQPYVQYIRKMQKFDSTKINLQVKQVMQKKSVSSLIGTIWKACNNGLIQSLVINNIKTQRNQTQNRAKQALIQQLQKYSEIPPKNSQVSVRDSIRLGGSTRKLNQSLVNRKQSQASNQSFHTVSSLKFSKKQNMFIGNNLNKISNFSLQNRFGQQKLPTSGQNLSPLKTHHFDNISQKFMTPMQQSSYFQTIHGNQRSFDFNNLGLLNSTFRNSQTIEDKDFIKKLDEKLKQSQKNFPALRNNFIVQGDNFNTINSKTIVQNNITVRNNPPVQNQIPIQGNFKKQKSKQKQQILPKEKQ